MSEPATPQPTGETSTVDTDTVEVSVPLRTEFIATLRTLSASLGADAGFSIDEIDDLRLAISEVVSSLIDAAPSSDGRIVATFTLGAARVGVDITTRDGEIELELDELASSILRSVVDEYQVDGTRVTLVKLASEAARSAGSQDGHPEHEA